MRDIQNILAEARTLPFNADGHIVSPRYLPRGSPYLEQWRKYLELHTPKERPQWLQQDLRAMRSRIP